MRTPALLAAFCATTYCIDAGKEVFSLRIGQPHPGFASWLARHRYHAWGVVTASNPGGTEVASEINARRNLILRQSLEMQGWCHLETRHVADDGGWPEERGFCILAIDLPMLLAVAREFGQAAIVYGGADGNGRLVWLEEGNGEPAREK